MNLKLIKIFILAILLLINIFLFLNIYSLKTFNEFEINFLDVGQGNSTLIKYKGLNFLIDSGKELYARKSFYKNISFFDRNIDFVFATHYDFDHVGNLLDYFEKYKIYYFFRNGKKSKAPIFNELLKLTKKEKIKNIDLISGDILKINDEFYIKVLFPEEKININKLRDNDSSLVLQIFYKDKIFLITGDSPKKIEK
jgi:competence protein ComEC